MTSDKRYLGDGVYIAFDGYMVILTTEDGVSATNTIYLEPVVVAQFLAWLKVYVGERKPGSSERPAGVQP